MDGGMSVGATLSREDRDLIRSALHERMRLRREVVAPSIGQCRRPGSSRGIPPEPQGLDGADVLELVSGAPGCVLRQCNPGGATRVRRNGARNLVTG